MARRRSRTSFGKEVYYILCIAVFIVSAIFGVWGPGGFKEMRKAQRELEIHRARVEELNRSNKERLETIEGLRSDPEALERYARKKGFVRKEEIIQQLPQEPPPPDPKAAPRKP